MRQIAVEIALFPVFQERWITDQSKPELELPVIREEVLMLILKFASERIAQWGFGGYVPAILTELVGAGVVGQHVALEIALKIPRLAGVFGDEAAFILHVQPKRRPALAEIIGFHVRIDIFRRQEAQRFEHAKLGPNAKAVVL